MCTLEIQLSAMKLYNPILAEMFGPRGLLGLNQIKINGFPTDHLVNSQKQRLLISGHIGGVAWCDGDGYHLCFSLRSSNPARGNSLFFFWSKGLNPLLSDTVAVFANQEDSGEIV